MKVVNHHHHSSIKLHHPTCHSQQHCYHQQHHHQQHRHNHIHQKKQQNDCPHHVTWNSLCCTCGVDTTKLKKCNGVFQVPLDWMTPGIANGFIANDMSFIRDIYQTDYTSMLRNKKLRLVLDLDETLIHTVKSVIVDPVDHDDNNYLNNNYNNNNNNHNNNNDKQYYYYYHNPSSNNNNVINFEHQQHQQKMRRVKVEQQKEQQGGNCFSFQLNDKLFTVFMRPHLQQFLLEVSKVYDIYMYTNGTERYASIIHQHFTTLFGNNYIQAMFSRKSKQVKEKKNLFRMLCKRSLSIIVDDRYDVWDDKDVNNIINVTPYTFEGTSIDEEVDSDDDEELIHLSEHLQNIHQEYFKLFKMKGSVADVRLILSKSC